MKIRHRMIYNKKSISIEFLNFLRERNAKFHDTGSPLGLVVVYLFEENEWKDELYWFLKKESKPTYVERIYSKEEMEQALWFTIRSKFRWEYPQPEDNMNFRNITYDGTHFCDSCGCGLKQKQEFKVKKAPQWGKRNFLMLNWIEDELFINDVVKDKLGQSDLKGYKLYDVLYHKKNIPIENIKQIFVNTILKPGLDNEEQLMKKIITCEKCGCVKDVDTGRGFTYKKDVFEGVSEDIVKSAEVFGPGHICARLIFISRNFYKLLTENSLDKDLAFEPLLLN